MIILLGVGAFILESLKSFRTTTGGLYKDDVFKEVFCKPLVEVPFEVFPLVEVSFEGIFMAAVFVGISSALPSSVKSTAYFFEINLRFGQH